MSVICEKGLITDILGINTVISAMITAIANIDRMIAPMGISHFFNLQCHNHCKKFRISYL